MDKIYIPAHRAEDWSEFLADPEKHWRKGNSARTLAYCWQEAQGFPAEVKQVLSPLYPDIQPLIIIPEHKVTLPGGGKPSQNDIFILARTESQLISITVEGKVYEPFGPTVAEWLTNVSSGKQERLEFLCDLLNIDNPPEDTLRYQLLHRTASAIIEARRFHAQQALMMVHSFSPNNHWFEDYANFVQLYHKEVRTDEIITIGEISNITLSVVWIRGDKKYLDK
ncbi:MAG: hypothetical protein JW860_01815 [Sedimentisphaerales bacterium]|nr:hypothetical protein [Sedimentisphaerales bacterium]